MIFDISPMPKWNKVSKERDAAERRHKRDRVNIEEFISQQLIKSAIASVSSAQADMVKAVGAFYKGLKDAGIPEETAVKMTEGYISTFTSLGDVMKQAVGQRTGEAVGKGESKEEKAKETETE